MSEGLKRGRQEDDENEWDERKRVEKLEAVVGSEMEEKNDEGKRPPAEDQHVEVDSARHSKGARKRGEEMAIFARSPRGDLLLLRTHSYSR